MTVYTVERCYPYEGCTLLGIFSTQELAEAFGRAQPSPSELQIDAVEVDALATQRRGEASGRNDSR